MPPARLSNTILHHSFGSKSAETYDITVAESAITSLNTHILSSSSPPPSLLLPTLCHPHIHLDKPYLLTCNHSNPDLPDYSDLAPLDGSFKEALTNTSKAKLRFTEADLYLRGSQLLATSYNHGVTTARCFVEVDHVTQFKTLEVGLRLKREFAQKNLIDIQLCVFAQDPIFSTGHGDDNRRLIEAALKQYAGKGIDALGTTPYVEADREASKTNISWAVTTALEHSLHLDFHLDYSLGTQPRDSLIWTVLDHLISQQWARETDKTVILGHCTALTNFTAHDLLNLSTIIDSHDLPVYFVGLPTSDMYMMGRPVETRSSEDEEKMTSRPLDRPRGTINVVALNKEYGIATCLGVNNVGNAFTPFGTGDPLSLASWGVGLYHAGTAEDAELLYKAVSTGARRAIGMEKIQDDQGSSKFGFLLVRNEEYVGCPGRMGLKIPARQRRGVRDVVWDVPEVRLRSVIR